jgi:TPR repeat protein
VSKPKTADEISAMRERTIKFRMEQATNGLPTAQCALGQNYLNGTDGFDTNKTLGVYWLTQSAAQGNLEAEELLKRAKLKSEPLEKSE